MEWGWGGGAVERALLHSISPPHAHLSSSLGNSGFRPESLITELIKTMGANSAGGDGLSRYGFPEDL